MVSFMSIQKQFQVVADEANLPRLLVYAGLVRLVLWGIMIASSLLYTHQASGDVVEYCLRHQSQSTPSRCFALSATYCAGGRQQQHFVCTWTTTPELESTNYSCDNHANYDYESNCAVLLPQSDINTLQKFYSIALVPLTRWDAARFLRLALRPQLRDPYQDHTYNNASTALFEESEQAHAFMPLYPMLIQQVALLLRNHVPGNWLPSTCEQCLVLSALIISTCTFSWSVVMLYALTHQLFVGVNNVGGDAHDDHLTTMTLLARRACLLFVVNPASVFFLASYSESLFSALVWTGLVCLYSNSNSYSQSSVTSSLLQLLLALVRYSLTFVCWWLATWTRSNGALYSIGFPLLWGLAQGLARRSVLFPIFTLTTVWLLYHTTLSAYNQMGMQQHCRTDDHDHHARRPEWCNFVSVSFSSFDLYSHVQRVHWNVGYFRYYELRQLPNFLLALPVVCVAISGCVSWIRFSWNHHTSHLHPRINNVLTWACTALRHSVPPQLDDCSNGNITPTISSTKTTITTTTSNTPSTPTTMIIAAAMAEKNALLLPHYAVLGAATLVCIVFAHIQISTRLLCSSCPVLYWYMATLVSSKPTLENGGGRGREEVGGWVVIWCLLYMLMGAILHSMWLPWT